MEEKFKKKKIGALLKIRIIIVMILGNSGQVFVHFIGRWCGVVGRIPGDFLLTKNDTMIRD